MEILDHVATFRFWRLCMVLQFIFQFEPVMVKSELFIVD